MGGRRAPVEDLTARARIRDAALLQFAEHGVNGATIRGIAEAAGVSPGLVQHHFGTKEELRRACDAYAIETIRRTKQRALEEGMADPGFLSMAVDVALPIQRYVARALVDGSPAAAELFDDAVAFSEELLGRGAPGMSRPTTSDLHAYAAVMTAMNFGLIVLHEHLSRALGADTLTREGYRRLASALLEIHADNLLSPELVEQARAALRHMPPGPSDTEHGR
ncbi:TetR/AcrR family transcriptional regulator [Thermomonospora cellulosilytica]|uniref:AcrR family transcriptional regulator n=1 Tax=Thermomonospora cellulosilytica TaxID=1411118 RepID=A0A7W3N0A7_9ACTN|nr:TetR/AcrR family transcriptional regulator [Thermomonospora cellulosilytica]MBA9005201.1 AcrR family transcriptional regulator [Thermomonospora cellulosilytica]